MKGDNIRTRWHRCRETLASGRVGIKQGPGSRPLLEVYKNTRAYDEMESLFDILEDTPKYYVEPSLMEICGRPDVTKSLEAMHAAGIARLPFHDVMCEVDGRTKQGLGTVHNFVVLHERQTKEKMSIEEVYHPFRAILFRLVNWEGKDTLIFSPGTYWLAFDTEADIEGVPGGETGFGVHYMTGPAPYVEPGPEAARIITDIGFQDFLPCKDAFEAMIVLLNTRGVHKEVIEPTRLNKARHKARKHPIPRHTVIRVAHTYSRDGTKRESPGWKQQFHIRPAYINYYWHGPRNDPERPQVKKAKLVESYFVNWDPENPNQKPKVTEAHLRA